MLLQFTGDIYFYNFHVYTFDKFLNEIFTRTPRGASLYYRTLKEAFSKAVLWNYIQVNPIILVFQIIAFYFLISV
jgi:hypothetical protein